MTVRPLFAWYDCWLGAYWDRHERRLYLFPVPMLGVCISFYRCPVGFCRKRCPLLPEDAIVLRSSQHVRCHCGDYLGQHKLVAYPSGMGHVVRGCDGKFYHL